MSQTPYGQPGQVHERRFGVDPMMPTRTSALAVSSLVFGLVCCLPATGLIGMMLGVAGIAVISRSEGRLRGNGLAVAGVILGLISTLAWVAIGVGMARGYQGFKANVFEPTRALTEAVEKGDLAGVAAMMDPAAAADVTPEALTAFRDDVTDKLGKFRGMLQHWPQFNGSGTSQSSHIPLTGSQFVLPVLANFEKGDAIILVICDSPGGFSYFIWGSESITGHIVNVVIMTQDGDETALFKPKATGVPRRAIPTRPKRPTPAAPPNPPPSGGGG